MSKLLRPSIPTCIGTLLLVLAGTASAREPTDAELFDLPFEELLDVVFSASSRAQPLREAPATIQVITAQQIEERGYRTVEDALRDLPGIDFVHVGGAFPTIFAPRGAWGDENRRILLMIDGIVENSLNGAFELAGPAYSLYGVERVEVIFGPASALYGANAFSGIVNLISKRADEQPQLRYRLDAGDLDTRRDDVLVANRFGPDWSLSFSGTRYRTDGPQLDRVIEHYADGYVDDALGWNLRLRREGDASDSVFGLHGSDTPMGNGTFGNTPTRFLGLPPVSAENPGRGGFYHAALGDDPPGLWHPYTRTAFFEQQRRYNERLQLKARLLRRETGLRGDSHSFSVNRTGTALTEFHGTYESDRSGIELQLGYSAEPTRSTTVGLQYYRDDLERGFRGVVPDPAVVVVDGIALTNINAPFLPRNGVRSYDAGLFVEHQRETDWLRRTIFTLGARFDRNQLYGDSFNPRLGLVNHPADDWTLKLLYGSAYRAPTPFELFSSTPVRVPNPDLQPERVRALEFGADYAHGNHYLQATAFYNRLSDVIVEGIPVGNGQTQIQNAARAEVRGLTAGWDYRPDRTWKLYANFTWQDAEQVDALGRFDIANIARLKANAGAQWSFAEIGRAHLAGRWVGDRSTARTNPLDEVPGYVVFDAHFISQAFWHDRLRLSASVRNLADRHYVDPGIRQADGTTFAPVLEQPGRSFWIGIEVATD